MTLLDLLVGETLDGRFTIRERLGSGAMGVVYRATQISIGRDVAVKVLLELDTLAKKRFLREAQVTSRLAHPNTVNVVEFGQTPEGHVYLVMELVRGHTLHAEISKGPMASRRITRIASQLCDALDAAHKLTIVHRDLKPENVMISDDGTDFVKVLDFGIARVLDDSSMQVTGVGLSAGTPKYMAPEVLTEGAPPAPPQDIYALGVLIGELALGRSLWETNALHALVLEKTHKKAFDDVPARYRALVKRLCDDNPANRPTALEARQLIADLDRAATNPVGIAPTLHTQPVITVQPAEEPSIDLDKLVLVDLDERDGRDAPKSPKQTPTVTVAPPVFEPPANLAEAAAPLEIEKIEKPPARFEEPQPRRRARSGGSGGVLFALLLIAATGAGIYWFVVRPQQEAGHVMHDAAVGDRSISIRIVGKPGTAITIDGRKAGKTPMSLKRTAGQKPIEIGAPGFRRVIVPDRDQVIDIAK